MDRYIKFSRAGQADAVGEFSAGATIRCDSKTAQQLVAEGHAVYADSVDPAASERVKDAPHAEPKTVKAKG